MAATIRDVAKLAGVGVGTVSRVLNDRPSVSGATRQRVLDAIAELNYSPNPIARRLSLGKTLTIAVIVPFFTRPSCYERLRGVEYALADSKYDLVIFNVENAARRDAYFREVPRRERVDGLLIVSLPPRDEEVDRFLQAGVPTVLIDAHHPRLSRAVIDDVSGGHLATQHLIDLGHRKIGYVSGWLRDPLYFPPDYNPHSYMTNKGIPFYDRYDGYLRALSAAGITPRTDYFREGEYGREKAREMAREVLALPDPPTAIFAASDTLATGVLEAAQDAGLRVPQDLSVIGYDDLEIAEHLHLTTIHQPLFASGVEGVELLFEAITAALPSPCQVLLPIDLIVRHTTAPAPQK